MTQPSYVPARYRAVGTDPRLAIALPPSLAAVLGRHAGEAARGVDSTSGIQGMRIHLDAIRQITRWRTDEASRQIDVVVARALARKGFGTDDFHAMRACGLAIQAMLDGFGSLDERVRAAMIALTREGIKSAGSTDGIIGMRARMGAIADLSAGLRGDDLRTVARIAATLTAEARNFDATDYYAFYTGFQALDALLTGRGSVGDRAVRAIHAMTDDALTATNNPAGIAWMRSRLYAILLLTQGQRDPRLVAMDSIVRDALQFHPGFNTADWQAFQGTFQHIKRWH
jgi:hypothetical protein